MFVENLTAELKSSTAVVAVDYAGLTVKAQQDLKKRLKTVGARLEIVKNTLFRIASKEAGLTEEVTSESVLKGPTALIITEGDPIAPIQILAKFMAEHEFPQLKVGIVENTFRTKEELITLSKLPSKETLFAQVVGATASPLYGMVGTLQGNIQKLLYILDQKAKA